MSYDWGEVLIRIAAGAIGVVVVWMALRSAVRTLVLPRAVSDPIASMVFGTTRFLFELRLRFAKGPDQVDRIMSMYAPLSVLLLLPVWLALVLIGYMGLYRSIGVVRPTEEFLLSGSSLFTLGYAQAAGLPFVILSFTEATIGLILVALLIAYLPAMYATFTRREAAVSQLASRAGSPPSAVQMILRIHRIGELENLRDYWREWERMFSEIEESHTSLSALVFFRSPNPRHSWITASGAVMDTAALIASTLDVPREPQAELCIRAGFLALGRIAGGLNVELPVEPQFPLTPISIKREEYDEVCRQLEEGGVPLKPDREETWRAFGGWRVNYDKALLALCSMTLAPVAPWSSDRAPEFRLASIRPRLKPIQRPRLF